MSPVAPTQAERHSAFCFVSGLVLPTNSESSASASTYSRFSATKHPANISTPFHITAPAARTYMKATTTAMARKAMISILKTSFSVNE